MATASAPVTFNPNDYAIPRELGFTIAVYILSTIYQRIFTIVARRLGREPTYKEMHDELVTIASRGKHGNNYQIKLNNILGQKNPTSEGNAIQLLREYFFEDAAKRKKVWTGQLATEFIDNVPEGLRIGFKFSKNHVLIVINADNRAENIDQDLYHLTMPHKPSDPNYPGKEETIHFTEEAGDYHAFYKFNTLVFVEDFGTIRRDGEALLSQGGTGGAPPAPAPTSSSTGVYVPPNKRGLAPAPPAPQGQGGNTSSAAYVLTSKTTANDRPLYEMGGQYYTKVSFGTGFLLYKGPTKGGKRRSTRRRRALRKTRKTYI